MLIIPAIDIKDGKCVRLTQGDFKSAKIYQDDPLQVALRWKKMGAEAIHLVDLDGAKFGKITNLKTIKKIAKSIDIPIQIGGGIRNILTIKQLLTLGIKKVILGTVAFENDILLKTLIKQYPSQIIVALDSKNGILMKQGWLKSTGQDLIKTAKYLEKLGVQGFIYTDVVADGTLTKPNYQQVQTLLKNLKVPIIVSGGISTLSDIKKLKSLGVGGVILGKALYEGKLNLKEAINVS